MNDLRRLLPYVQPYLGGLALSLVLLVCAGSFEVLVTALAIPLFDEVLATGSGSPIHGKFAFVHHYLALLPGGSLTRVALALLTLTLLKGACVYFSNSLMNHVGQSVVMELRNRLYGHVLRQ